MYVYTFESRPPASEIGQKSLQAWCKSRKPVLSEVKVFSYLGVDLGGGPYVNI